MISCIQARAMAAGRQCSTARVLPSSYSDSSISQPAPAHCQGGEMASDAAVGCAAEAGAKGLHQLLNDSDVEAVKDLQLLILGRLQDSTAVLSHFNDFSERSMAAVANDFSKNTRLLRSIKKDLHVVFRRIRDIKSRIASQFPDAFNAVETIQTFDDGRPDLEKPREQRST